MEELFLTRKEEDFAIEYSRLVARLVRPYFLQGMDYDDLYQEGMIGLLGAIRSYDPLRSDNFELYAALCIKHRLYDALRRGASANEKEKKAALHLSQSAELAAEEVVRNPETEVLANESAKEIQTALSGLLSTFEASVLDHYLQGFTVTEIADRLSRPAKSVDNAILRCRRKTRQYLQRQQEKPVRIKTSSHREKER